MLVQIRESFFGVLVVYFNHLFFKNNGEGLMQFKKSEAIQVSQQFLTTKLLRLILMATIAFVFLQTTLSFAQNFPNRPIKVIVTYPPGGSSDLITRLVGQKLGEHFGTPVLVENKAGAGSLIGSDFVAKASPDGYTLLVGGLFNMVMNKALMKNLPYDPAKDFVPLGYVSSYPFVLTLRPDFPANNLAEMVKVMKEKPGQYSYGSAGVGTLQHVWGNILLRNLGLELIHVPFKGSPPAYQEMMAGRLDMIFDNVSSSKSYVQTGRIKGVAVSSEKRTLALPNLPTINETNLTKFNGESWFGIFAPTGTSPAIVNKLRAAMAQINKDSEFNGQIEQDGGRLLNIPASQQQAFLLDEINRWVPVVMNSNIKVD
jgi:tripartite-type tricarboxylate transporter receptor subunit TctC